MIDYRELLKVLFRAYIKETGHSPIPHIISHLSSSEIESLAEILKEVSSE